MREGFKQFIESDDALDTITAFEKLCCHLPQEPTNKNITLFFDQFSGFSNSLPDSEFPFKYRRLLELLRARWESTALERLELVRQRPSEESRAIVISGAGPCGLRASIEGALLGMKVTLVERRGRFSRHNVLKLWKGSANDLLSLGLQTFYPSFKGQDSLLHLGTRELQLCLLKVALLFGVKIAYKRTSCGVIVSRDSKLNNFALASLDDESAKRFWDTFYPATKEDNTATVAELELKPYESNTEAHERKNLIDFFEPARSPNSVLLSPSQWQNRMLQLTTDQGKQEELIPFVGLLIAEGEKSRLIRYLGFDRKLTRYGPAIGIVINLDLELGKKPLPEFVYSRGASDWRTNVLGTLERDHQISVENIEYMRGGCSHFVAVTVFKETLLKFKIFKSPDSEKSSIHDCLTPDNLDVEKLHSLARTLATACGVPETAPFSKVNGVQIFDFSTKGLLSQPFRVIIVDSENGDNFTTTFELNETNDKSVAPVFPIGDALQNPYWHQGLGINRGFHNSLDSIFCLYRWMCGNNDSPSESLISALEERKLFFKVMDWATFVPGSIISTNNSSGQPWKTDPTTRYSPAIFKSIHMHESERNIRPYSLPPWIREKFNLKE